MNKKRTATAFATLALTFTFVGQTFAYTVQSGDTMWKIASKNQTGVQELINANPSLKDPNKLYVGQNITIPTVANKAFENKVVELVNQERAKAGLKPLTANWELARVTRYKSEDMRDKKYFDHQSPTYGSPFDMMSKFGITYKTAGENIAGGQTTPEAVMQAWMKSPGHKANILNPGFTQIGVGYAKGGSYGHYWTQQFISK
ncbi:CAP domain-containing protein [Priestia aryabhattai]